MMNVMNSIGFGYSETKIKPYLKMAIQRIQISNNKKSTSVKHQKREIATLLAENKEEKARIKVEHIIRDDFTIEGYEVLELLCELLHERIKQITNSNSKSGCPSELKEAVCSLIWASDNCDIDEFRIIKNQLVYKYGNDISKQVKEDPTLLVNARLYSKLVYKPPSKLLVTRYLEEIAKGYQVDWAPTEIPLQEGEIIASLVQESYGTPTGYSVSMAPGSGLVAAYTNTTAISLNNNTSTANTHNTTTDNNYNNTTNNISNNSSNNNNNNNNNNGNVINELSSNNTTSSLIVNESNKDLELLRKHEMFSNKNDDNNDDGGNLDFFIPTAPTKSISTTSNNSNSNNNDILQELPPVVPFRHYLETNIETKSTTTTNNNNNGNNNSNNNNNNSSNNNNNNTTTTTSDSIDPIAAMQARLAALQNK